MKTYGETEIAQALDAWENEIRARCQAAMAEITARLEEWAKAEHAYTDRTGALTASITGEIIEISEALIRGTLSAGTTAAVFLELARQGKWAFLWPVIERHKADIAAILERHLTGGGLT